MTANVSIIIASKDGILRIPNTALRFNPTEKRKAPADKGERGQGVWTLENNKPKRIKITAGISDGTFTEATAGELKEGLDLIVESLSKTKTPSSTQGPRMF